MGGCCKQGLGCRNGGLGEEWEMVLESFTLFLWVYEVYRLLSQAEHLLSQIKPFTQILFDYQFPLISNSPHSLQTAHQKLPPSYANTNFIFNLYFRFSYQTSYCSNSTISKKSINNSSFHCPLLFTSNLRFTSVESQERQLREVQDVDLWMEHIVEGKAE